MITHALEWPSLTIQWLPVRRSGLEGYRQWVGKTWGLSATLGLPGSAGHAQHSPQLTLARVSRAPLRRPARTSCFTLSSCAAKGGRGGAGLLKAEAHPGHAHLGGRAELPDDCRCALSLRVERAQPRATPFVGTLAVGVRCMLGAMRMLPAARASAPVFASTSQTFACADVTLPLEDAEFDQRQADDERGEVGGFGSAHGKVHVTHQINHEGGCQADKVSWQPRHAGLVGRSCRGSCCSPE